VTSEQRKKNSCKEGGEVLDKRFCINRVGKLAEYCYSGVSESLGRQTEERRGGDLKCMEGVTEGKSDIITRAVNQFMANLIIINNNTMLLLCVSL
jgi:hypothetical protein